MAWLRLWLRLMMTMTILVTSCVGLGYLAGALERRRGWAPQLSVLLSVAIALIWPAIILGATLHGASHYQRRGPSDPGDAPVYVLMGAILFGAPVTFLVSLLLALGGTVLGRRRRTDRE